MNTNHPLDAALALTQDTPGHFLGHTAKPYWNMVGPFGGITAAAIVRAIMAHPERLGEPLSLTVNYAGALSTGPFTVQATPVRTNRSTQHWSVTILQTDAQGRARFSFVMPDALTRWRITGRAMDGRGLLAA